MNGAGAVTPGASRVRAKSAENCGDEPFGSGGESKLTKCKNFLPDRFLDVWAHRAKATNTVKLPP
jgi:hypothetical protein